VATDRDDLCTPFAIKTVMFRRLSTGVKKFWAALALLSAEMIVITAVFFVSLITFIFLVRRIFVLKNEELDHKTLDIIRPFINDTNTSIMNFVTFFGKHEFLIPANLFLIAYFLFVKKHRWYSIRIPAVAISSLLLMFFLKNFFGRERPDDQLLTTAENFSFPSGHALMSVTFYGILVYLAWKNIKSSGWRWTIVILIILWIHLVGFSRLYLRKHYLSDVVAGFAIGFLWLVISLKVISKMEKYSKRKLKPIVEQPAATAA
jgi:membrane-associated phospholipid phosphatase